MTQTKKRRSSAKKGKNTKKRKRSAWRLLWIPVFVAALAAFLLISRSDYIEKQLYTREYRESVEKYAEQYELPENFIYAMIRTESRFNPRAVSNAGAVGLMQLMPSTFRWLTEDMTGEWLMDDMLYDPAVNIRYGTYYLRLLYDRYGDLYVAAAAYNAGPGQVDAWIDAGLVDKNGTLDFDRIPFRETRRYVKAMKEAYKTYSLLYP